MGQPRSIHFIFVSLTFALPTLSEWCIHNNILISTETCTDHRKWVWFSVIDIRKSVKKWNYKHNQIITSRYINVTIWYLFYLRQFIHVLIPYKSHSFSCFWYSNLPCVWWMGAWVKPVKPVQDALKFSDVCLFFFNRRMSESFKHYKTSSMFLQNCNLSR